MREEMHCGVCACVSIDSSSCNGRFRALTAATADARRLVGVRCTLSLHRGTAHRGTLYTRGGILLSHSLPAATPLSFPTCCIRAAARWRQMLGDFEVDSMTATNRVLGTWLSCAQCTCTMYIYCTYTGYVTVLPRDRLMWSRTLCFPAAQAGRD
jgi:hypothetical protein